MHQQTDFVELRTVRAIARRFFDGTAANELFKWQKKANEQVPKNENAHASGTAYAAPPDNEDDVHHHVHVLRGIRWLHYGWLRTAICPSVIAPSTAPRSLNHPCCCCTG